MDDNRSIPEGFTPVWNDDFEGDSISFIEWNQEIHEPGTFFNELQAYIASEKTVSVKDGILYICPVKEHDKDGSIKYFSGKGSTQGKHEIQYGRFEARIKVPRGKGLRPFFSISSGTSKHGRWPRFSEIDIMEYNTNEPLNLYGSVHSQSTESDDNHILQQGIYEIRPEEDPSMSFHTYACDWEPGTIRLYFDGTEYFSCSVQEGFDHPFYVSFGVGIGGDWPGSPDKNTVFGIENAMQIEYLRIYRRPEYKVKEEGKRRKLIGVCGVWEDAENFSMFIRSLQTPDIIRDYVTAVFTFSLAANIEEDVEAEIKFAQLVDKAGLSGIVIFGEMIKSERIISLLISNAHRRNIPVIMFEHTMPGCINLAFDYKGGFEKVVRHVIEDHGLKTVDMFAGFRGNPFSEERIEIYKKVLEENDIAYDETRVHYGDFWDAAAFQVLNSLINSGYKIPEAFICANDSMAIGVCDALKKNGCKVPEDCIVTGFDGIWKGELQTPSLTTCAPDYDHIRDEIKRILDNKITGSQDIYIDYKLIKRHSCNCHSDTNEKWPVIVNNLNSDNQDYYRHMLEMGRFISNTISMSNIVEASKDLQHYLWLWKDQYYFIGIREDAECIHAVFEGMNGEYAYDRKYFNMPEILPELGNLLIENSGINVLFFKQAQARAESFGYIASGLKEISLRSEQRFEEFSLFVSAMIHSVLNNRQLVEANHEIERMSEADYLTGLYNRRGFFHEVNAAIRREENQGLWFTLFSADLDGLKNINDYYGHLEGDLAIKALASAIKSFVGSDGFCARFGGDEFSFVIIGDRPLSGEIDNIRTKLSDIIRSDTTVAGKRYRVKASIGLGEAMIDSSINVENLSHIADLEMYKDKYSKR